MIPAELELRARELVREAIELGGNLWKYVTPASIELLVEAVALDLQDREERQERADNDSDSRPHASEKRSS